MAASSDMTTPLNHQPSACISIETGDATSQGMRHATMTSSAATAVIDAQPNAPPLVSTTELIETGQTDTSPTVSDHISAEATVLNQAQANAVSSLPLSTSYEASVLLKAVGEEATIDNVTIDSSSLSRWGWDTLNLDHLPNEILMHILGLLDVSDLLATSRINHHFRTLSVAPVLHTYRLQHVRVVLPPLLTSPSRPTLAELISRHIFLTKTTQISRRLARNLVAIRLSRCLPQRPSAVTLVQRGVLPPECVSGCGCTPISPALVAKRRAVEKEKLKDSLRRWVGGVWRGEVKERGEGVRQWEESAGVGRVWRLRRFWERIGRENSPYPTVR